MTSNEVASKINRYFDGKCKAYSVSRYKVEVDVSKELSKTTWSECAEYFGMKDNSKSIPNSYKYDDVTVVFFYGALQKFTQDKRTNWTISSRPQNYKKEETREEQNEI